MAGEPQNAESIHTMSVPVHPVLRAALTASVIIEAAPQQRRRSRRAALRRAFDDLSMQILDTVEAPGRIVIAFMMRGRHTGPFVSPVGTIAPTHRDIEGTNDRRPGPHRWCHFRHLGRLR